MAMYLKVKKSSLLAHFAGLTTCEVGARLIGAVIVATLIIGIIIASVFTVRGIVYYAYEERSAVETTAVTIRDTTPQYQGANLTATTTAAKSPTVWNKIKGGVAEYFPMALIFCLLCIGIFTWVSATGGVFFTASWYDSAPLCLLYQHLEYRIPNRWFRKIWTHTILPAMFMAFIGVFYIFFDSIQHGFQHNLLWKMLWKDLLPMTLLSMIITPLIWGWLIFIVDIIILTFFFAQENVHKVNRLEMAAKKGATMFQEMRQTPVGTALKFFERILYDFYHKACRQIVVEEERSS